MCFQIHMAAAPDAIKIMTARQKTLRTIVIDSKESIAPEVSKTILDEMKKYKYTENDIFALHLALEEALINAVRHGNKADPQKKVTVKYAVSSEKVEIQVRDQGSGFDPTAVPDPTRGRNLYKTSGRGLLLMRAFTNKLEFNEAGNCVRMVRHRKQPPVAKTDLQ